MTQAERLSDGQRQVGEITLRGGEREAHAVARHRTQAEQRLQAGHAAADDYDGHSRKVHPRGARAGIWEAPRVPPSQTQTSGPEPARAADKDRRFWRSPGLLRPGCLFN
jgi:hypothetical protein